MAFADLLALLRDPGDAEIAPSIYDDLNAEYTAAVEGGAARIAELETQIAELVADNQRLKALNFDLLMSADATPSEDETPADETDSIDDENAGVDSLFGEDDE